MTKRGEFEKRFPVPKGIEWINDTQGYRITSDDDYWWDTEGQAHFRGYLGHWIGWRAAREQEGGEFVADDEPLPCPFCGKSPHRMPHPDPSYPQIQCRNIECPIGVTTEEVSLESWNVRAHPPQSQGVPEGWLVDLIDRVVPDLSPEPNQEQFQAEWSLWADRQRIRQEIAAALLSTPAAPQADEWVKCAEMDDELRWILGRPNFACVGIAERLRELGKDIERKAESEQAAAIHWMMSLYVQHGADWLKKGNALLEDRPQPPEQEDGV